MKINSRTKVSRDNLTVKQLRDALLDIDDNLTIIVVISDMGSVHPFAVGYDKDNLVFMCPPYDKDG